MSTQSWKPIEFPVLGHLTGSNQTFELQQEHWPSWGHTSTQLKRLWAYCPDADNPIASTGTTATIVGRLLTERFDPKDSPRPYNYNFYLLALSTEGRVFQSPPIRTSDPRHHSSQPADWLDTYGSPF